MEERLKSNAPSMASEPDVAPRLGQEIDRRREGKCPFRNMHNCLEKCMMFEEGRGCLIREFLLNLNSHY